MGGMQQALLMAGAVAPTPPPTLDAYTSGLVGAYALHRIITGYSGDCIRLYDTQDASTHQIGFDGSSAGDAIDYAAIAAAINVGFNGRVSIWYDQNDINDVSAPSAGASPGIWNASGVAEGGVNFPGSSGGILSTAGISTAVPVIVVCFKVKTKGSDTLGIIFEQSSNYNSNNAAIFYYDNSNANEYQAGIHQNSAAGYSRNDYDASKGPAADEVVTLIYDRSQAAQEDQVKFRVAGVQETRNANGSSGTKPSGNFGSGLTYNFGARVTPTAGSIIKISALAYWELSSAPDSSWLAGVEAAIGYEP
jgi:hypothetical protein